MIEKRDIQPFKSMTSIYIQFMPNPRTPYKDLHISHVFVCTDTLNCVRRLITLSFDNIMAAIEQTDLEMADLNIEGETVERHRADERDPEQKLT